ncbi:MAG: DUF2157 domain-containing protein [Candidatus Ancaeobacter aquaticus]|nr:DUF2157 domain-containing protein [Candidatus Ancaeobacter aquaticus]
MKRLPKNVESKADAQRRADQIRCFQAELELLENEKILLIDEEQRSGVTDYHENLISQMSSIYDIDSNKREKQLSLGMKVASLLGALGLAASVFFLFYQFWGRFSTGIQVSILTAVPFITLIITVLAANREKTGYFSKLFGMVCFSCFVLNIVMLGQIFNMTPSDTAFAVWAVFAFMLAYATNTTLLLIAGIVCIACFLSARMGAWFGFYWFYFGVRPENFLPTAVLLFFVPLIPHKKFSGFDVIYRVFGMLLFFMPILVLSNWGAISYLNISQHVIESIYQTIGFVFSSIAIWFGIRKSWPEVVNTGYFFLLTFLYTKFFDWWWEWMPKYVFFLIIALTAILILLIFKRLRNDATKKTEEVAE